MNSEQIASLEPRLREFVGRFRECFKQERSVQRWLDYMMGLMADIDRKSVEPIALMAGSAVRTLQEFLSMYKWDDPLANDILQRLVAAEHDSDTGIGVIDSSGHPKQGDKTPGVQRQWCGQTGKRDNCVVGQHLLYTDNHPTNPFSCMIASDLYLPKSWDEDRIRCREAKIPDDVVYRPKWQIAIAQLQGALGNGVRFSWVTFDEEYGTVPGFWFELDRLGVRGMGEVQPCFNAWINPPVCRSGRAEHSSRRVDNLARYSPVFCQQPWRTMHIKDTTRGPLIWQVKTAMIRLVAEPKHTGPSVPTTREYWLIVANQPRTKETKYFVSNAPPTAELLALLKVGFSRYHVEQWFERAKQEAGLGDFEVRTYQSLIRHWLSSRVAMLFLARETQRLRGEKSGDYVGAGGRGGEHPGREDLGELLSVLVGGHTSHRIPSVAESRFL